MEEEIARYPEFQTDDFAVVVQPLTTNLTFPVTRSGKSDLSYLSTDCFHISQKGNARGNFINYKNVLKYIVTKIEIKMYVFQVANALWNNLMQPVGAKTRTWKEVFEEFICPTEERPFIATLRNSRL